MWDADVGGGQVGEAVKQLMDISIAVMVIVYIIIRIPTQVCHPSCRPPCHLCRFRGVLLARVALMARCSC